MITTRVDLARQSVPRPGTTVLVVREQPARTHRPHRHDPAPGDTQCRTCWGWVDDYRHF